MPDFFIGVGITYYNEREMLTECLTSLAQQTRPPDEIIVYDDASAAPAGDYIPNGLNVRLLRGATNKGPSYGRNQLLKALKSDYIHFHDADDLFLPNWCEQICFAIETKRPDVIITNVTLLQDGELARESLYDLSEIQATDMIGACLGVTFVPSVGTYSRALIERVGGYTEGISFGEDYEYHLKVALTNPRIAIRNVPLILQRHHERSRSRDQLPFLLGGLEIMRTYKDKIPRRYWQQACDAAVRYGRLMYLAGYFADAPKAFDLAYEFGQPTYHGYSTSYRWIARSFGPVAAERLALVKGSIKNKIRGGRG